MALFETIDIRSLAEAEGVKLYTPEESAESIVDNWHDFLYSRDLKFYAYFPLREEHHERTLKCFGALLGFVPSIPEEQEVVVLSKPGYGELISSTHYDIAGEPCAIEYVGRRFEAVQ